MREGTKKMGKGRRRACHNGHNVGIKVVEDEEMPVVMTRHTSQHLKHLKQLHEFN